MYYENEGTCAYMYFLPLKFSQYPSRPVPVPELFGKYPTRPVPKSKTPTRQTLVVTDDKFTTANCISCVHVIGPLFDNATIQMNQILIIKSKREWSKKQNGSEENSSGKRQGVVTFWSQFVLPVHNNA